MKVPSSFTLPNLAMPELWPPQVPSPAKGEEALAQALREIKAAQSWRSPEDRDRLMSASLKDLATTFWNIGYDDGKASEVRRVREWLDGR